MVKQNIVIFFFLIASSSLSFAQGIKDFEISIPNKKVAGSIYNTLQVVDIRDDTTHLGVVQLGTFNKKKFVMAERPLQEQMQDVLKALNDTDAQAGELLMLIRRFSFAEIAKAAFSEKGFCQFRAALFVKKETGYQQLDVIDTVIAESSIGVSQAMFRKCSEVITNFIKANITKSEGNGQLLSFNQVLAIDNREKAGLAVYNTISYKEGLYKTYKSFANQTPDEQDILVEISLDNNIKAVRKATGKERILSKDIYAIVYEGKPYIATSFGFYPLKKRKGDFYFTGKEKMSAYTKDVLVAGLAWGITGALLASSPQHTLFDMKIDHISGGLIRLREVKE